MNKADSRRDELESRLQAVWARLDRAREQAGREDEIKLVVVTKTFPASDVEILAELGVRDVGENKDQEAKAKRADVQALDLCWHMIGRLQRNKAASVCRWADVVESVDRVDLVEALADAAERVNRPEPLGVLIQVSLDPPERINRGGAPVTDIPLVAQAIAARPHLRLDGVMAVAPHPETGIPAERAFAQLAEVSQELLSQWPQATVISAGMSHDLEAAIACGATQVRIGGAILGERPAVQ
jgi:pyridoxal phosphate enzyme (YggS family)